MKKKAVNNILFFLLVVCFISLCFLPDNSIIKNPNNPVFYYQGPQYIPKEMINKEIKENFKDLLSRKDINTRLLEDSIETLFYIKNAEVYLSLDETRNIIIQQEIPFIRTLDENGDTCFFTKDSIKLDLVEGCAAENLLFIDFVRFQSWPQTLYLINYLYDDDFLSSLINKVSYNEDSEYVLQSESLDFKINIGTANRLNQKFEMIKLFLKDIVKDDRLYKDEKILIKELNVAYDNQIICVK
tara:strand:+ start:761 stop:1486 length:726 start_codon:yes stop_codon:yes gene_type:complete